MTTTEEYERQRKENIIGYNGGTACDSFNGPCSCGAWHDPLDFIIGPNKLTLHGRKKLGSLLGKGIDIIQRNTYN